MIDVFLKKRSYLGCIRSSLNIYGENIVRIFKKVWIWCLLVAAMNGVAAVIYPRADENASTAEIIMLAVFCMAAFLSDIKIKALFFSFLNNAGQNKFKRMLKVCVAYICILIVILAFLVLLLSALAKGLFAMNLSQESADISFAVALLLFGIAATILVQPFSFSILKCLLEGIGIKDSLRWYRVGMRRVGFLFTLFVVLALVFCLLSLLFALPGIIVIITCGLNDFGMSLGDPTGLPQYFAALKFMATVLVSLYTEFFSIWAILVMCHAYGNIETAYREKERYNIKKEE